MAWKALTARATLFPAPSPGSQLPDVEDLYRSVWGSRPDSYQRQPNPLAPAVAQGKLGPLTISCVAHLSRVDFNFNPGDLPPPSPTSLQVIDDSARLYAELVSLIAATGRGLTAVPMTRIALYVHFITLLPSMPEANRLISGILPPRYRLSLEDEEDFVLQVNRPRPAAQAAGLRMNYITKWSVDRFQLFALAMPVGATPGTMPNFGTPVPQQYEQFGASIVFDNNNVPGSPLPADQQRGLLSGALSNAVEEQKKLGLNVAGFE